MTRRISMLIAVTLVGALWLASDITSAPIVSLAATARSEGSSHWRVRLTPYSGPSRMATLDGVGCSEAICSRVSVRTRAFGEGNVIRRPFDTISAIKMTERAPAVG